MDPFVRQLADLCSAQPTRAKWVFVPTHALGRTFGERLVREGTNWLNLRFVTPLDIALRMGAPFLVDRGIDPSEEELGPALAMRLLLDLPEQGGYFRPLAHHPTMAQVLWTTIRELRMAGVTARDLPPGAFASGDKHRELCALLDAYERFLESGRKADMALVYEEALDHPEWCPIQDDDCRIAWPDVIWAPLQQRFIDALPGERIPARSTGVHGIERPRRLDDAHVTRVAPSPAANPLAFLLVPQRVPSPVPDVAFFHAGGREAELEEVFRRILASGRPLDEVEIVCASDDYPPLAWEKALRHDWLVTIGPGLPAAQTRPGRALLGFCAWIESNFAAGTMRRLLQSGDVRLQVEDVTPGLAARILFRAQAGSGRETYGRSLQQVLARYVRVAKDTDNTEQERKLARQKARRVEGLRDWLNEVLASIPQPDSQGTVDLRAIVQASLAFLDGCAARASALDGAAVSGLADAVRELLALQDFRSVLPVALRFIRERVEGLVVATDRPRPGHLHVSTLANAAYSGRPLVFVVGLEEGRVFPAAVEDPVLLDAERAAISPALRLSSDRTQEAVYTAVTRLATCGTRPGRLCVSYSSRDTREYRETFPSWLMLQAYRLRTGAPESSYPELRAALGAPASGVPSSAGEAASDAGWWLAQLKAGGYGHVDAVLRGFSNLAAGRRAEMARASTIFTEFDGCVPDAGVALDPSAADYIVSATQLEEAAECPFRHFLRRGLGLQAVEDDERDRDVWLDPLTRGAELHDLYAEFLRRCRSEGRSADLTKDREWLREAGRRHLEDLRREMPPPSDEVYSRESDDLLRDLDLFLEEECDAAPGRTPVAFEVAFGRDPDDDEELAQADPVVIPLAGGRRLRLRGRIDRIDRPADGTFEIVDYKTGGFFEGDWSGTFAGGTRLQHALYGIAAIELLKQKYARPAVARGVYYFSSARGRQERVRIPRPSTAAVQAVLSDLRDVIAAGTFIHAPDENACKWCDLGAACGPQAHDRAAAKLGDPGLQTYVRLTAHE